jgi:DUF1680 family protein
MTFPFLFNPASAAPSGKPIPSSGVQEFDPACVRLTDGPFKTLQELHRNGVVGKLDPERLLVPYRRLAGIPLPDPSLTGYGGWDDGFVRGHYAGHYLSAASRMYAATGDSSFREKTDHMVGVLAACQEKLGGGYLAAFGPGTFDGLEAHPQKTSVPYYTIHKILAGLVDAARYCGNRQALEVASRMSDYFAARIAKLTPDQIEAIFRTDYTGNPVNEFGGMADALSDLYVEAAKRGDSRADRHLRLAAVFNRDWITAPLADGEDRLDGLHGNTPAAKATGWAKYALVSGDEKNGRAAEAFWQKVTGQHSFVNGGNSFHEKLRAPGTEVAGKAPSQLNMLTEESCNTQNMIKLTGTLFRMRPDPSYGDYCENALLNHILATIAPDDGKVIYYMPLRPGSFRIYLDSPYCCQASGIENTPRFNEAIYFHDADSLWVNLYIPSVLDWRDKGLKLRLETRYPESGQILLKVQADSPVNAAVNLRIPAWLDAPASLSVNGLDQQIDCRPGTFVRLERRWKTGDVVELNLPLTLRVRAAKDDPETVSFFHGPVLLAGELGRNGMPASDIGGNMDHSQDPPWPAPVFVAKEPRHASLPVAPVAGEPMTYEANVMSPADGKPLKVRLRPFYQVHHQRFAVYWKILTPGQFDSLREITARREEHSTFIGNEGEEKERELRGERTGTGSLQGRNYRDTEPGGWFSYRLALPTQGECRLVCTYWGGETSRRDFDILLDDTKIASQTLERNKPGEFFDVSYPVPEGVTHGKQFVTVLFRARPGSVAGGLFGIRLEQLTAKKRAP